MRTPFFLTRLTEAIHKYSGLDLDSPGVEIVLAMYFVNQSTFNIGRKIQRLALGPQTPIKELIYVAFSLFHSQDKAEEHKEKKQANFLAAAL